MTENAPAPGTSRRPQLILFDVNETLSDLSGMADDFAAVGAPATLAATWFASVLRDGFALTVTGDHPDFADLASTTLRTTLAVRGVEADDAAVARIMDAFMSLPVHGDVPAGVHALVTQGIRLVTLSNGSTSVARGLLDRNGLDATFERLLSVEDAPAWKPARAAYEYALDACDLAAGDAMLVAVHPWDIHGAGRAGLRTAYLNRTGAPYPGHFEPPELEASSLVDLARQLGGMSSSR